MNETVDLSKLREALEADRTPIRLPNETMARVADRITTSVSAKTVLPSVRKVWSPVSFGTGALAGISATVLFNWLTQSEPQHRVAPVAHSANHLDAIEVSETERASTPTPLAPEVSPVSSAASSQRLARHGTESTKQLDPNSAERLLVQAALNELRRGDVDRAEALLRDASQQFREGIFLEERMWLWVRCAAARSDNTETINRAEEYLEQFPAGVHQQQARALVPSWRQIR